MFKRAFWLTVGAGIGAGSSMWANRWARTATERYTPVRVSAGLAGAALDATRTAAATLREAVAEGRLAMHEREAELRADLEGRILTPALEAQLRAELIDRALPPEVRAELIRQALPPELEARILDQRLSPEIQVQLRRELVSRRARETAALPAPSRTGRERPRQ